MAASRTDFPVFDLNSEKSAPIVAMKFSAVVLLLGLVLVADFGSCHPAEQQPTKFNLSTGPIDDNNNNNNDNDTDIATVILENPPSRIQRGMEFLGKIGDAVRLGRGRLVNSISLARNIFINRAEELVSDAQNNVASVIALKNDIAEGRTNGPLSIFSRVRYRETSKLENEDQQALLEKPLKKPVQGVLENFLRPTPLVDGIKEQEKYGNSGDKFIGIGRALVGGFEGLSNFLNTIVDLPIDAAKKTSRGVTEALNQLGARLIGLQ